MVFPTFTAGVRGKRGIKLQYLTRSSPKLMTGFKRGGGRGGKDGRGDVASHTRAGELDGQQP